MQTKSPEVKSDLIDEDDSFDDQSDDFEPDKNSEQYIKLRKEHIE